MDIKEINEHIVKMDISKNSTIEDLLNYLEVTRVSFNAEPSSHKHFIIKDLFFREIVHKINNLI